MLKTISSGALIALLWTSSIQAQDPKAMAGNKVTSIDHVVINVIDIERALVFYKKLGFKINNEEGWRKGQGQVSVQIGEGQKLNIHKEEEMGPNSKFQVTSGPDDRFSRAKATVAGNADFCLVWDGSVEQVQQHLRAAGIDHVSAPRQLAGGRGQGTSVYFRDPDGNLWEYIVYVR
jgi:catechol 2,3-dioxygenase-like lactoylglutathione lyase family enzyme